MDIVSFLPLTLFSILSFWKESPVLCILTAAISVMTGLYWGDIRNADELGITIAMVLIAYCFICFSMGIYYIIQRRKNTDRDD